ncbi:MAG TPA: putative ABC exporter domain-containing protein [Longimicrobium sp.]|nr:putative ABC exporter domain-containing protein [Longimicrobium sp.]
MNPALFLLMRRAAWGRVRFLTRRMRTVKGAVGTIGLLLFFVLIVANQLFASRAAGLSPADPELVRNLAPLILLAFLLLEMWTGRALAFSPSEIDFLFPAPLSRRELLAYHVLSRLGVRVLSGLWASIFVVRHSPLSAAGVAAVTLAMVFLHLTTELLALLAAAVAAWTSRWIGRVVWSALLASLIWAGWLGVEAGRAGAAAGEIVRTVATALPVRIATAPMRPLSELFAAESTPAAFLWLGVVLAILGAQFVALMLLDVAYTERSLASSRRLLERARRMRGGGDAVSRPWKLRIRVPSLAPLGAGAPLARRQLLELLRTPRALLLPLAMPLIYIALFIALPLAQGERPDREAAMFGVGLGFLFPLLIPNQGFDFRRDLDRMAYLKGLPLSPFAVAAGQLFAPVALFVAAQLTILAAVTPVMDAEMRPWLLATALVTPPLTWAMVATENLLFLWMPYRVPTDGSQNAQFVGKGMLVLVAKLLVFAVLGVMAGTAGFLVWKFAGENAPLAAAAGAVVIFGGCLPLTWGVGAAFRGFDVAIEVPA